MSKDVLLAQVVVQVSELEQSFISLIVRSSKSFHHRNVTLLLRAVDLFHERCTTTYASYTDFHVTSICDCTCYLARVLRFQL